MKRADRLTSSWEPSLLPLAVSPACWVLFWPLPLITGETLSDLHGPSERVCSLGSWKELQILSYRVMEKNKMLMYMKALRRLPGMWQEFCKYWHFTSPILQKWLKLKRLHCLAKVSNSDGIWIKFSQLHTRALLTLLSCLHHWDFFSCYVTFSWTLKCGGQAFSCVPMPFVAHATPAFPSPLALHTWLTTSQLQTHMLIVLRKKKFFW